MQIHLLGATFTIQWLVTTLIAVAALALGVLNDARDRKEKRLAAEERARLRSESERAELPIVAISNDPVPNQPGWHLLHVSVKNRAPYGIMPTNLSATTNDVILLDATAATQPHPKGLLYGRAVRNPLPLEQASASIGMNYDPRLYTPGGRKFEKQKMHAYMHVPTQAETIDMKLEFATREAISRPVTVPLRVTLRA